jgi:drug/metabolite transporter (DMT)-like permease
MSAIALARFRPLPSVRVRLVGAMAATVLLWASAFVAIRATLPELGYGALASTRLLLGALAFAALARPLGVRRPARAELPWLMALGATGFTGYQVLLSAGETTVPAGTSALLFGGAPVLVALMAGPALGERLSRRAWLGVALGFSGVAIVALGQGASLTSGAGAALVLAAVVSYAVWVVLSRHALRRMGAAHVTAWSLWFGALFALPFAGGAPGALADAPSATLLGVLFLGVVVTTVPFLLWAWVLARVPAGRLAPCLLLISPAAVVIAWIALGEQPALSALLGGLVTLAGVAIVQAPARPRVPAAASASPTIAATAAATKPPMIHASSGRASTS